MNYDLNKLIALLTVQPIGEDRFRGDNMPSKRQAVFGGQVAAQALSSAIQCTDESRIPHSMHCYFLRPGDTEQPIEYHVVRVRDGGSFSVRHVTAKQGDKAIFVAIVSLQVPEKGLEHQQAPPVMVPRDKMITDSEFWRRVQEEHPALVYLWPENYTAIDILSDFRTGVDAPEPQEPVQSLWCRANGSIVKTTDHLLIVAFQSDMLFLNTALHAHPYTLINPAVQAASLDHSIWFYGDVDATEWLYYDMYSPVSSSGRGLNHGYFYTESGRLVAATTQEGLMRVRH